MQTSREYCRCTHLFASVILVVALLSGCSVSAPEPVSPAYAEGYRYGCYLGYDHAGYNWYWGLAQTPKRYEGAPEWQEAWERGYRECFDRALVTDYGDRGL